MMMDCPRCGFSQPKDRYCANCGLDVENFTPEPESKFKSMIQSTAFQVIVVLIVVLALGSGIYQAQRAEVSSQVQTAENSLTTTSIEDPLTPPAQAPSPAQAPTQMAESLPPPTGTVQNQGGLAATANLAAASTSGTQEIVTESTTEPAPPAVASGLIRNYSIQYIEIPRLLAEQIAAENQILDRSGATYSFVIMSQPNPTSFGPGVRSLPGSVIRPAATGQRVELAYPAAQNPAMVIEITTNSADEQDVEFDISSFLILWDMATERQNNIQFTGKYTIPKGATLVIVGVVPGQQVRQEDLQFFNGTPLSILGSASFRNNSSRFALVIQPK